MLTAQHSAAQHTPCSIRSDAQRSTARPSRSRRLVGVLLLLPALDVRACPRVRRGGGRISGRNRNGVLERAALPRVLREREQKEALVEAPDSRVKGDGERRPVVQIDRVGREESGLGDDLLRGWPLPGERTVGLVNF